MNRCPVCGTQSENDGQLQCQCNAPFPPVEVQSVVGDEISPDICGFCGEPGADKYKHPCHWPGEENPEGEFVHAECEQRECERAFQVFRARVGDNGIRDFLRHNA